MTPLNQNKRIIALDVGTRSCGVAMTDPMGIICQPVANLHYKGESDITKVYQDLFKIFSENMPAIVVVGLPLMADGTEGTQAGKIKKFIFGFKKFLKQKRLNIEDVNWDYFDESLTTRDAHEFMMGHDVKHSKRKKVIDKMAAVLILQTYMDESA